MINIALNKALAATASQMLPAEIAVRTSTSTDPLNYPALIVTSTLDEIESVSGNRTADVTVSAVLVLPIDDYSQAHIETMVETTDTALADNWTPETIEEASGGSFKLYNIKCKSSGDVDIRNNEHLCFSWEYFGKIQF